MGLREEIEAEDVRYRDALVSYCARVGAFDPAVVENLAAESKARQRAIFERFWPDASAPRARDGQPLPSPIR